MVRSNRGCIGMDHSKSEPFEIQILKRSDFERSVFEPPLYFSQSVIAEMLHIILNVTNIESKREGKRSIGPGMKYGHANLRSFRAHTNEQVCVFNLSSLSLTNDITIITSTKPGLHQCSGPTSPNPNHHAPKLHPCTAQLARQLQPHFMPPNR